MMKAQVGNRRVRGEGAEYVGGEMQIEDESINIAMVLLILFYLTFTFWVNVSPWMQGLDSFWVNMSP